ncbi:MAG TPA: 4-hydroxy-3-methylbut-2-enyl diphosphate reductase, partial [Clostridiales bacterium]|nr:4-hydroxy-3-methylbut-2-enyl diphosphate reductase [Clostridiales bacterium]
MELILARSAGFCFGVERAVFRLNELLDMNNGRVYML